MIFEKHRFEIWNQLQHPYKHTLAEFSYVNPALPGVVNVEQAINWILAVLYPNTKPAVNTPADLPLVGNTLNDYRVVLNDGDGKAASYRWEQREGEGSASWHKIYDMDWGADSILAAFQTRTQDLFVFRQGYDDLDSTGAVVTGLYAGQVIYGGKSPNSNLTLRANSGDGTGPHTGFVQSDDNFRPTVNNVYDLGTNTERWKNGYVASSFFVGAMTLTSGLITDTSGTISFDNENLVTTGNITGGVITGTSLVSNSGPNSVTIVPGSYTDTSGFISFGSSNLSTTGTLAAGVVTLTDNLQTLIFDPEVAGVGQITSSTGTISFDNENLVTTGNITGGLLSIDNIQIDLNTIYSTNVNGNIVLLPNGTGVVDVQKTLKTLDQNVTGIVSIVGQLNVDNLRVDGNDISSTNPNGDISITPNGTGVIVLSSLFRPSLDNSFDIGTNLFRFNDLFLGGGISNGTNSIPVSTLLSFRFGVWRDLAQTQPAQTGDSLFFDAVNGVWLASAPDTEIIHNTISGLVTGDAGHTQFVMLAGRAGGQIIQGGTGAGEGLVLESTSNVSKGLISVKDTLIPFNNASYSGGWSGVDLGDGGHYFRDIYSKGELRGARLENFTFATLPASSGQNIGRVVYATDVKKAYIDTGTQFIVLGVSKYISDTVWNGTETFKDIDVSANIVDARNAIWQLRDNANNFEIMNVTIKATSATNVRIEVNVPLAAGSYRLIGLE